MTLSCDEPLSLDLLIAYDLGELDEAEEERVEGHYFSCPSCSARLAALLDLGDEIRKAVRRGKVTVSVSGHFIEGASKRGLQIRRYALGPGEQAACTVAPDDDFVACYLKVGQLDSGPVDIAVDWTTLETQAETHHLVHDVLVDRELGQVILLFSGDQVRSFPKSQWRMVARPSPPNALDLGGSGQAEGSDHGIGPFTLNHTPWQELQSE